MGKIRWWKPSFVFVFRVFVLLHFVLLKRPKQDAEKLLDSSILLYFVLICEVYCF